MQFIIKLKTGSEEFNKSTRFLVSVTASGRVLAVGRGWPSWPQGHTELGSLCHVPPKLGPQGPRAGHGDVSETRGKWGLLHEWR